ncbi:hypothetical protein E2562_036090 [Oryza meyeriana var. granulata]|uniref:Uncharacterized protein n=1 Tax=Oryza meyeriana var. granulata TaxID=110450 RepID=A0A6G1DS99_9ORYZ|nr:hypothetical protein E2562_036090 [Oryza meyeriana var. granulata]
MRFDWQGRERKASDFAAEWRHACRFGGGRWKTDPIGGPRSYLSARGRGGEPACAKEAAAAG